MQKEKEVSTAKTGDWGRRRHASTSTGLRAVAMMLFCPVLTLLLTITTEKHDGNLLHILDTSAIHEYWQELSYERLLQMHKLIACYLVYQAILYKYCPGSYNTGQHTPGGNLLQYKTNGLFAFAVTYICFWLGHVSGAYSISFIATHFTTLITALNIWGLVLTIAIYVKGCVAPTNLEDRVFTGNSFYDLFMGVELNPRIEKLGDLKLFIVGRTGMMIWPLVITSFAMLQYEKQGYVSTPMLVGVGLQLEYIVDFFWNEHWYLRTIDIAHDHVGFYMAWGCMAWLPTTYTLHTQYVAQSGISVGDSAAIVFFLLGTAGYVLFRLSNSQKYRVRDTEGRCSVWGKPATFITASYTTADGADRQSILLTCGWWGQARHINYVGDLILSISACATSGTAKILPWFYAIYMCSLLLHRCFRDEARCSKKYGQHWQKYCEKVRWRLIPYLF